jgi:phosphomannomutase
MHKIARRSWNEDIFRTYDVRGIYPEEINEDAAYTIARSFAGYLSLSNRDERQLVVLVSADARDSSPALKEKCIEGLLDEGVRVIDAGLSTTPMHYFMVNESGADGGIMITASHIPPPANGMKLSQKKAIPLGGSVGFDTVKNTALRGIFSSEKKVGTAEKKDFLEEYISFFENNFSNLKTYKTSIVVDPGNGMTAIVVRKLFEKFPMIKVKYLYDTLDMTFPNHEANPLKEETLEDVKIAIGETHSNLGVSFDGDGDRMGVLDETSTLIQGDFITALLSQRFGEVSTKKVVITHQSSRAVFEYLESAGFEVVKSRVGHAFLKSALRGNDAVVGGEISGHFYFKDFFFADSALFALFSLLSVLQSANKPLSALSAPLKKYARTPEINLEIEDKEKAMDLIAAQFPDTTISYFEGVTVDVWSTEGWWCNVRPSGTENLIRFIMEAKSPEILAEKKKLILELLDRC